MAMRHYLEVTHCYSKPVIYSQEIVTSNIETNVFKNPAENLLSGGAQRICREQEKQLLSWLVPFKDLSKVDSLLCRNDNKV